MKFSIIIATCNRPERLSSVVGALSSIKEPFELVVVDNGEGEASEEKIADVKSALPVRYLRSAPRNKCEALNVGIRAAKYEWLAFTDDDCLPDGKWLEEAEKYIEKNPDIKIFGGRVIPGPAIGNIPKWLMPENEKKDALTEHAENTESLESRAKTPRASPLSPIASQGTASAQSAERRNILVARAPALDTTSSDPLGLMAPRGQTIANDLFASNVASPPQAEGTNSSSASICVHLRSSAVTNSASFSGLPRGPAIVDYDPLPESGILSDNAQVPLGANIFVHKSIFDKCGMYDVVLWNRLGKHALGCDDAEFAMRVRKCGLKIGYCREAVINHPVHEERATIWNHLKWSFSFGVKDVVIFSEDGDKRLIPYYLKTIMVSLSRGLFSGWTAKGVCELMAAFKYLGRLWGMVKYTKKF